jgi:hypothetical protein
MHGLALQVQQALGRDPIAPGANAAATSARFCSSLQRRRRSGPLMSWYLAIAPSLALLQTSVLASVPTRPDQPAVRRSPRVGG